MPYMPGSFRTIPARTGNEFCFPPLVLSSGQAISSDLPVPRAALERMVLYLQELEKLRDEDVYQVASHVLAERCGVLPTQIRKDLCYLGAFGVRGTGYAVEHLYQSLREKLGINRQWPVALVGIGNTGRALIRHDELGRQGFVISALFDSNPLRVGNVHSRMKVHSYDEMRPVLFDAGIAIGMIATPPERAQDAAHALVVAGVKGIINFAPLRLQVPPRVFVEQVGFLHHAYAVALHLFYGTAHQNHDGE